MTQRIVCVCPALGVASEVWLHRQLEMLRPHLVTVITWQHHNPETFALPGVEVIVVPKAFRKQISGVRRLYQSLTNPNIGPPRFGRQLETWLSEQIQRIAPDAVLGHYGHFATLVARVCRDLPVQLYAHFNGHDLSSLVQNKASYRRELTFNIPRFSGLIVVAKYMEKWLLEHGATPSQIARIPYGVPLEQYLPPDRNQRTSCTFLAVGRLVAKKAPHLTIEAFAKCLMAESSSRLIMVGDGALRKKCESLIARNGIEHAVEMRGVQSPSDVREAMSEADVFVQHSRTSSRGDKEGWPVSIAEAMAAGLPIVSTRHAGIVDQVEEGFSGFLGDEGDVDSMAASMITLAKKDSMRRQMGINARTSIEAFDCRTQVDAIIGFIQRNLGNPEVRPFRLNAIKPASRIGA